MDEETFFPNRKQRRTKFRFKISKLDQKDWRAKARAQRRAKQKFIKKQRRLNEQKDRK